jgi:hypothetical protein
LRQFGNVKKLTVVAKHSKYSVWEQKLGSKELSNLEFLAPVPGRSMIPKPTVRAGESDLSTKSHFGGTMITGKGMSTSRRLLINFVKVLMYDSGPIHNV